MMLMAALVFFPALVRAADTPAADAVVVDADTERVIHGAVKFLVSQQGPTGSWAKTDHQAAITGYVLVAMMSAGELPGEGEAGKSVTRGMNFLLDCVRPDGYIAAPTGQSNMYGHGIATIALAELYGQTRDQSIRPKLERAVRLIVSCQNPQGGWRYAPRIADADISVTVLQVVALRAAKNAGLDVPQVTIDNAVAFVKSCSDETTGGFTYMPHNRAPGFARTAAAIYSLQVCGRYDDPLVKAGSDYLFRLRGKLTDQYWTYGNFYAAPAEYMIGGDSWKAWYGGVHDELMSRVNRQSDGICYWKPVDPQGVGDVYATSVYTMILAMPWHYLPLYQR
jgi:squalene cyclase